MPCHHPGQASRRVDSGLAGAIDPGLAGAVAILDQPGALVALYDTPTLTLSTSRGTRQEYDLPGLVALLAPYAGAQAHVTLEESQAMPGQGVRSMFMVGVGFGVWLALLAALALPHTRVRPAIWKRALGLGKDKEASRLKAMQLFPTADLRHKKDHGRVEALLLAWYGVHGPAHRYPHGPGETLETSWPVRMTPEGGAAKTIGHDVHTVGLTK